MPTHNDFITGINSPVNLKNLQKAVLVFNSILRFNDVNEITRNAFKAFYVFYLLEEAQEDERKELFLFLTAALNTVGRDGALGSTELNEFCIKINRYDCPTKFCHGNGNGNDNNNNCLCESCVVKSDLCRFFIKDVDILEKLCLRDMMVNSGRYARIDIDNEFVKIYDCDNEVVWNSKVCGSLKRDIKQGDNSVNTIKKLCSISPTFKTFVLLYPIFCCRFNERVYGENTDFHAIIMDKKDEQVKKLREAEVISDEEYKSVEEKLKTIASPLFGEGGELKFQDDDLIKKLIVTFDAEGLKFD